MISAEDDDSPTLFYLLSGTDASSFSIDDETGQLKTYTALNFEGKKIVSGNCHCVRWQRDR